MARGKLAKIQHVGMRPLLYIIFMCSSVTALGQQMNCKTKSDTLLVFYVELIGPKPPMQEFWATAKQFDPSLMEVGTAKDLVRSFMSDKNYCPDLPAGYVEEMFKCFNSWDSAGAYLEKSNRDHGNVYELIDAIRKTSFKRIYTLQDGTKVKIRWVSRYGSFLIKNLDTDKIGSSSDEFDMDRASLKHREVLIPFKTFSVVS